MEADAGKTGGSVERLLIEHGRIRQNANALGKIALQLPLAWFNSAFKLLTGPAATSPLATRLR
jgi:hypothetical protein